VAVDALRVSLAVFEVEPRSLSPQPAEKPIRSGNQGNTAAVPTSVSSGPNKVKALVALDESRDESGRRPTRERRVGGVAPPNPMDDWTGVEPGRLASSSRRLKPGEGFEPSAPSLRFDTARGGGIRAVRAFGGAAPHTREVAGSNPAAPMKGPQISGF
jgi:hypothetical protein